MVKKLPDEKTILALKIKGYVTVGDAELTAAAGTAPAESPDDAAMLQEAMDLAVKEDIRKVIIDRDLTVGRTVRIPAGIEVKFAAGIRVTCAVPALFVNEVSAEPEKASWSFEDRWIYLIGEKDAVLNGDICFFHGGNLVLEDLNINGSVSFEFCREVRMERNVICSGKNPAVRLMRGCNNYIVQYNTLTAADTAMVLDASLEEGTYVIGKDTDIHEIIIRDNRMNAETAVFIGASEASGVFNVQYDGTKTDGTALVIGREDECLDKKRYFNISSTDHTCRLDRILHNEVKHCYFGE